MAHPERPGPHCKIDDTRQSIFGPANHFVGLMLPGNDGIL
jgi:hypothetical protein